MQIKQFNKLIKFLYPEAIQSFPGAKGKLFLSFDDGPDKIATLKILDILDKFQVKATFFCLGENVEKYPNIFELIQLKGHQVGNHGYSHLNGFKTNNKFYIQNVEKADKLIGSILFRPPYGKISPFQYFRLKNYYKIILWDVMAFDFDNKKTANDCCKIIKENARDGSIIVFHDTIKSYERVVNVLPVIIDYYLKMGFSFEIIST
jgi:peptidoglycan/xylan/chitin deacetylase (PgdA/CDA1 family)